MIFKNAVFSSHFFVIILLVFCMTANSSVNAIILVQRCLRFSWKNECEFLQRPLQHPPFSHKWHRLYISAARGFYDRSQLWCVKSRDNKFSAPSCRGSSLSVPHRLVMLCDAYQWRQTSTRLGIHVCVWGEKVRGGKFSDDRLYCTFRAVS